MYDIAVVGAGPAGSSLTYFLTAKGFKVLTLERERIPALRTICGEYLPDPNSIAIRGDMASAYYSFFKPFIVHKVSRISLELGNRTFSSNFLGYSIDRKLMIRERLREAVDGGAELKTGEAFISATATKSREGFHVRTSRGTYTARYIVGADGFESRVSKISALYNETKCDDLALAFSDEIELNVDRPEEMRLIIDEAIAPGTYAWIIPRGTRKANVGVGVRLNRSREFNIEYSLRKFIRDLNARRDPKIRVRGRFVPVGGTKKSIAGEGIFLIGDAAGMTIPSNGGGMHTSILASYLLAQSLDSSDPISFYIKRVRDVISPMVELGLTHRRAADFLIKTGLLWKIIGILPEEMVQEVIEVRKGKYYALLKSASILYGLVRGKVGSYPLC